MTDPSIMNESVYDIAMNGANQIQTVYYLVGMIILVFLIAFIGYALWKAVS